MEQEFFELLLEYIRPELFILILFNFAVGLFLKKAPWFKEEWEIPFIILALSVIVTVLYVSIVVGEGFTLAAVIANIIQGTLIAAVTVFGNEIIKQVRIKRKVDQT